MKRSDKVDTRRTKEIHYEKLQHSSHRSLANGKSPIVDTVVCTDTPTDTFAHVTDFHVQAIVNRQKSPPIEYVQCL
jgi:hypothetical protein